MLLYKNGASANIINFNYRTQQVAETDRKGQFRLFSLLFMAHSIYYWSKYFKQSRSIARFVGFSFLNLYMSAAISELFYPMFDEQIQEKNLLAEKYHQLLL